MSKHKTGRQERIVQRGANLRLASQAVCGPWAMRVRRTLGKLRKSSRGWRVLQYRPARY